MVNGSYTTRQGFTVAVKFPTRADALARLRWLDKQERDTRANHWTDSSSVRFNYNAEAEVIRRFFGLKASEGQTVWTHDPAVM
jgi:hypothetical protein